MPAPFTTPVAKSVPFEPERNPDFNGQVGVLTANNTQDAIEEVYNNAPGKQARFALTLLNNSSLSNGQRFTYSELLPNTQIILPRKCRLKEITFSNATAAADWSFEFRNYTAASNYTTFTSLFTWSAIDTQQAFRSDRNDLFQAGDEIRVIFTDTGTNPSDAAMVLFFVNDDT
jgi:hypothetical protein